MNEPIRHYEIPWRAFAQLLAESEKRILTEKETRQFQRLSRAVEVYEARENGEVLVMGAGREP